MENQFKVGEKVLTIGNDEHCFDVVCSTVIHALEPEIVMKSGGFLWVSEDLEGYYKNTKVNRKMLQDQCDKAKAEWREAVRKQFENIKTA